MTAIVTRPCYATREAVAKSVDIKFTARMYDAVDRAIQAASESIDAFLGRRFYVSFDTNRWDWPNYQYTYPWRLWLNQHELAGTPTLVQSGALSSSPVTIPPANYTLWPYDGPPFTRLELRRDQSSTFGNNPTPQEDILITGPFGYWDRQRSVGALAAAMTDTTTGLVTIPNGNVIGVGDVLIIDTERMIVQDKAMVSTAVSWSGLGTASAQDNLIQVPDGTKFAIGETLLSDSERLWIADIAGNTLVVKRGWDGTAIAAHTGGTLYALRQLVTTRGDLGTTATTHLINANMFTAIIPGLIRDLALGEAGAQVSEEIGAYATVQGGGAAVTGLGVGLADKWEEAETRYARQVRKYAI